MDNMGRLTIVCFLLLTIVVTLSVKFGDVVPQEVNNVAEPVPAYRVVPSPVSVALTAKLSRGRA